MTLKKTIISFCEKKNVYPPFTRKKIEKAGYEVASFLLEMKDQMKQADDIETEKNQKIVKAFFTACDKVDELIN